MPTSTSDIAYDLDLEVYRGSTFDKTYDAKLNGSDWDLSGMTGRLSVKSEKGGTTEILALSTSSGLSFGDGSLRIVFTYSQTESIPAGRYYYDILGKQSGVVSPIAKGSFIVNERVTDPDDIS